MPSSNNSSNNSSNRSSNRSISSAARRARAATDSSDRPPDHLPDRYAGGLFANQSPAGNNAPASAGARQNFPPFAGSNSSAGAANTASTALSTFEVRGFATDPKHSGYQILTNYESTYWRAFVGVQAWALYEVLRSFCHNGNNVCYPSINYLLEVLGIKQRRVLTGWSTEVKGKNYYYPGLIETLQNGGLVIAEVVGEGPMLRYLFHVNLTPDLLRPEQVTELPALLQSKHTELLQTHFAEMAELASRRRPTKSATNTTNPPNPPAQNPAIPPNYLQNEDTSTKNIVENAKNEGMTNCQTPMTNCHTPSDNLSHKQHQYNNTQLTSNPPTNLINNNSGGLQQELLLHDLPNILLNESTDVVVALTNLGLADSVVKRLSTRFSRERILEKIDYLAYLESHHPNKVKNPRGWLRRAIEENYGAPDGYLTAEQRAAQANAPETTARVSYAAYVDEDEVAASQMAQANAVAEREYQRAARRDLIRRIHAPEPAILAFWELVQNDVRFTMTPDHYRLIAEASILWMGFVPSQTTGGESPPQVAGKQVPPQVAGQEEETVAVAIWDREIYRELLHPNRVKALARTMSVLAKRKLTLLCEYWDEEGRVVPAGTPPP